MQSEEGARLLVEELRAHARSDFSRDAARLRRVHALTRLVHVQEAWRLDEPTRGDALGCGRITEVDLDRSAARDVAAATGLSPFRAEQEVRAARTLCTVLGATLAALEAGRIDGGRARVLAEAVDGLPVEQAREVEAAVLDRLPVAPLEGSGPVGPWDGPAPREFTRLVNQAVAEVRTDHEEQVRRDVREQTGISAFVHPGNPALTTMTVTGPTEQILPLCSTAQAQARATSHEERAGRTVGMVEVDLLAGAWDGTVVGGGTARGSAGARRELGVVLHADTLLDHGEASQASGEVRGAGAPVPVTAAVARVVARQAQDRGAGTCVLLVAADGCLERLVRVGAAPAGGWSRATLVAATRRALARQLRARHETTTYEASTEISETTRARDPVCTFPGCGVPASRCDLDHQVPHPRGPTSVANTSPRSRRCHRWKSAGLWSVRARLDACGHVVAHEWTSPLGTRQVVEVPSLPGC